MIKSKLYRHFATLPTSKHENWIENLKLKIKSTRLIGYLLVICLTTLWTTLCLVPFILFCLRNSWPSFCKYIGAYSLSTWTFPAVIRWMHLHYRHSVNIFALSSSLALEAHIWFINMFTLLVCLFKFLGRHSENIYLPFPWLKWTIFRNSLSRCLSLQFPVRFESHLSLVRNERTPILMFWTRLVIGRIMFVRSS